jgi:hypothetical protein
MNGLYPIICPCVGEENSGGPIKLSTSNFYPLVGRNMKRASENILCVSEDKLVRKVLCHLQLWKKIQLRMPLFLEKYLSYHFYWKSLNMYKLCVFHHLHHFILRRALYTCDFTAIFGSWRHLSLLCPCTQVLRNAPDFLILYSDSLPAEFFLHKMRIF